MIGRPPRRILPPTVYDWLLFFHLLAAAAVFATLAIYATELVVRRRAPVAPGGPALGSAVRLGGILFDVGGVALLVLGIWLAFEADYGITDEWIIAAIVFWVIAAATGARTRTALLGRPRPRGSADLPPDPSPRPERMRATLLYVAMAASVLVLLLLMIFKPGAGS